MNVSVAELSVVVAALLLYWFVPAILAGVHGAARRKAERHVTSPVSIEAGVVPATEFIAPLPTTDPVAIEPTMLPPLPPASSDWPAATGLVRRFSLFDLRDAGALVVPTQSRSLERGAAAWSFVHAQRPTIGALELRAPIDPNAFAIAGVQRGDGAVRIVVWLFDQLWPESEEQAIGRALFDITTDGRVVAAVEPA